MTYHEKIKSMPPEQMAKLFKNILKFTVDGQRMIDIHIDDISHEMPCMEEEIQKFLESEAPFAESKPEAKEEKGED